MFGPRIGHIGCHVFHKKVFAQGPDLPNAVEVAVYARIGTKPVNFESKAEVNNIFGSTNESISFIKDIHNKTLNPAQKPFEAIKQLVQTYCVPGEFVLDLFAGTGQVARAAIELGIGSVSVEKDPTQVAYLKEFLEKAMTSGIVTTATYDKCNKCDQVIGADEGLICKVCGKSMHKTCAVKGEADEDLYCSDICKNSDL